MRGRRNLKHLASIYCYSLSQSIKSVRNNHEKRNSDLHLFTGCGIAKAKNANFTFEKYDQKLKYVHCIITAPKPFFADKTAQE